MATLLNHALASYVGTFITYYVPADVLKWTLAATFIGFGLWMLMPDKDEGYEDKHGWGPFLTTTVAFFFAGALNPLSLRRELPMALLSPN